MKSCGLTNRTSCHLYWRRDILCFLPAMLAVLLIADAFLFLPKAKTKKNQLVIDSYFSWDVTRMSTTSFPSYYTCDGKLRLVVWAINIETCTADIYIHTCVYSLIDSIRITFSWACAHKPLRYYSVFITLPQLTCNRLSELCHLLELFHCIYCPYTYIS